MKIYLVGANNLLNGVLSILLNKKKTVKTVETFSSAEFLGYKPDPKTKAADYIVIDIVSDQSCDGDFFSEMDKLYSNQTFIVMVNQIKKMKIKLLNNNKVIYLYRNELHDRLFEIMGV